MRFETRLQNMHETGSFIFFMFTNPSRQMV